MKHTRMKSRFISILCMLLLIPQAASCASDHTGDVSDGADSNPQSADSVTASAETDLTDARLSVSDDLPEKDWGGETFLILTHIPEYYCVEEEDGDLLNDVYFKRQRLVEERFHVDIKSYSAGGIVENVTAIKKNVMAGESAYDLAVIHQIQGGPTLITEHMILDWNDIPYIQTEKPWWNRRINETVSIEGHQYYIAGYITRPSPFCMFYNPALAAVYDLEDIFGVVEEGRWTLDYLLDITKTVSKDLDGDGKMTPDSDQYGITFNNDNTTLNFMYSSDICSVIIDESGMPVPNVNTDKMQKLTETINQLVWEGDRTSFTTYQTQKEDGYALFKSGRALMVCLTVGDAVTFRDTDVDFSVIPYPKFDEAQDGYYTHVDAWNGMLCVPKTAADPERTGVITEAFAAETWKHVIPVYYDQALSDKYFRDEKSVEMMDLIFDGILYDFGYVFDDWNGCTWTLPNLVKKHANDVASYWASIEKKVGRHYEKLYQAILSDE